MKIGILTVPFNNNYGGLLQAYALKTTLVGMGNDVVFLNRRRSQANSFKFKVYRFLVRTNLIHDFLDERVQRLSINTNQFKKKYLQPITEAYYTTNEFKKIKNLGIDLFVVGSDQVWRYKYAGDSIGNFFYDILIDSKIPRISYAASFGVDYLEYPRESLREISRCLNLFDGISVREKSGMVLLREYFGVPENCIKCVLDPTMLLSPDQYCGLLYDNHNKTKNHLFTYILDQSLVDDSVIVKIAREMGRERVDLKAQTGDLYKIKEILPVEEWLASIYYANCVITDSFHGTVFSIIFNKPFIVVSNKTRGTARMNDLLSLFGLQERQVERVTMDCLNILEAPIDWCNVNKRLETLRSSSLEFIEKYCRK